MKILVGLDLKPKSEKTATEIAKRTWPSDTSFILLHVVEPFPIEKSSRSVETAVEKAEKRLHKLGNQMRGAGRAAEELVIVGRAAQQILKLAETLHPDRIIVGSHGAWLAAGYLLGSTAETVLRHATCSVEILRHGDHGDGGVQSEETRILIATDGSPYSTIALRSVASGAWPKKSKFRVVSIPHPSMPLSSFPKEELKKVVAIKHAKQYAKAGAEILRGVGLKAEFDILLPYASDGREIVKEAKRWGAQMIVLGSHGWRGFDRLRLGSVSEYVALHAPCSVEVVRGNGVSAIGVRQESTGRTDGVSVNSVLMDTP